MARKRRRHLHTLGLALVFSTGATLGCSGGRPPPAVPEALLESRVQAGDGELGPPFGGAALLTASIRVVSTTTPTRTELGEGEFDAERVTIAVPPELGPVVIALLGEGDVVLAATFVDGTPRDGESLEVMPFSTESSAETVFIERLRRADVLDVNAPLGMIRARVSADVAGAFQRLARERRGETIEPLAVGNALWAMVVAEKQVAEERGPTFDLESVANEERDVARDLSRALYAATSPEAERLAQETFADDLDAIREARGLGFPARLEIAEAQGFAGRARVQTAIAAQGGSDDVGMAWARALNLAESRALRRAVESELLAAAVAPDIVDAANALADILANDLRAANTHEDLDNAVVRYRAGLIGDGASTIFARALDVNATNLEAATAARQTARDERQTLETSLAATVEDYRALPNDPYLSAAESIAQNYVAMRTRLAQNAVGLAVFGPRGTLGLALLLAGERLAIPVPSP